MTRDELLATLIKIHNNGAHNPEVAHEKADAALIEFINDPAISAAYDKIEKLYT